MDVKQIQRYFMFYLVATLLTACAQLGVPAADTFSERLAAAYSLNSQVRATATELLNAKKISSADGQHVMDQTNNARAGLDVARELSKINLEAADGKLVAIRTALTAVQAYLSLRKGK